MAELRTGDPETTIAAYAAAGRVHLGDTAEAVREQLVGDWWAARSEHGVDGIMIAGRVADVTDLNLRARERMLTAGAVSGPTLTVNDLDFAAGDEVICLRNDRRLGVVNGTRGRITAVDIHSGGVTLATRAGERSYRSST